MKETLTKFETKIKTGLDNKNVDDATAISIHIEGEEDLTELDVYQDTEFIYDEDSVLILTKYQNTNGKMIPTQYLFRLVKIISVVEI